MINKICDILVPRTAVEWGWLDGHFPDDPPGMVWFPVVEETRSKFLKRRRKRVVRFIVMKLPDFKTVV